MQCGLCCPASAGRSFWGAGNKSPDWAAGAYSRGTHEEKPDPRCRRVEALIMRASATFVKQQYKEISAALADPGMKARLAEPGIDSTIN
jgi:hypothetical protein